jgi:hypothetical protein
MLAALSTSAFLSLRVLVAYSKANGLGIGKQGAGLVLFVTLQRQSMS